MMNDKKKCGIATLHSAHNYGSVLQAYALLMTLQKMGLDVEILDFRHPVTTSCYEPPLWNTDWSCVKNIKTILFHTILRHGELRKKKFSDFINNHLKLSVRYNTRKAIKEHYDYLICGSDQIWNPIASGCNDLFYYLDFGSKDTIKFSYAASSGSRPFADEDIRISELLKSYRSIGVRESYMKEYISARLNLHSTVNPDPTFLLPQDDWTEIEVPCTNLPQNYLLVYSLANTKDLLALAHQISQEIDLPVVFINTNTNLGYYTLQAQYNLHEVGPQEFVWLFRHASFVVTNSFHGNMFSIIFRKSFVTYDPMRTDTRVRTLHNRIGLGEKRHITCLEDFKKMEMDIDYGRMESNIQSFIEEGLDYIKSNLQA